MITLPTSNPVATPYRPLKSQRARIAQTYGISADTLRRWVRFAEECCLDWWRVCPGKKTPRFLHPYQRAVIEWILSNRDKGSEWLEHALLHDERLTYQAFQQTQTFT